MAEIQPGARQGFVIRFRLLRPYPRHLLCISPQKYILEGPQLGPVLLALCMWQPNRRAEAWRNGGLSHFLRRNICQGAQLQFPPCHATAWRGYGDEWRDSVRRNLGANFATRTCAELSSAPRPIAPVYKRLLLVAPILSSFSAASWMPVAYRAQSAQSDCSSGLEDNNRAKPIVADSPCS